MQVRPAVSFYHDCRRKLKNGKYPVKIIVTFQISKEKYKQDPYGTGISLTKDEFKKVFSKSVPIELQKIRIALNARQEHINNEITAIERFITPELLRKRVTGEIRKVEGVPVTRELGVLFDALIEQYTNDGQIGSAISFKDAKKCFLRFAGPGVLIDEFDEKKLIAFEKWGLSPIHKRNNSKECKPKPLSLTTLGMYLRNLRRVFNVMIERGLIPREQYPFGEKKYVIRTIETVKNALDESQKDVVFMSVPASSQEMVAMKYFMFSYYCRGMNFTDMAFIRPEKVFADYFEFVREKTKRTVKNVKVHKVPLRAEARAILDELGGHSPYCFGIIDDTMNPETKNKKIKLWYSWVNKHMNRITKRAGIPFKVNTYNGRHTAAKLLIEKGVHMQYVSEMLTHTSIQTTEIYTRGMNIEKSKGFTDLL
jgi:integrase/recombinase XerD